MDMTPIHVLCARRLAMMWCTGPMLLSIIASSKTTVASAQRYYPMRGFGSFTSASRECSHRAMRFVSSFAFVPPLDNLFLLPEPRDLFRERLHAFNALILGI